MDELITPYIPTLWSQVRFMDRGYKSEKERAKAYGLIKNHVYLVQQAVQHSSHTILYLIEFPDIPFRRFMFDDVPDPEVQA